jgi:hypothetical protein
MWAWFLVGCGEPAKDGVEHTVPPPPSPTTPPPVDDTAATGDTAAPLPACRFSGTLSPDAAAVATFSGEGLFASWGLGDVDGDGLDDAVLGSPSLGEAYVFLAPFAVEGQPADAVARVRGAGGRLGQGLVVPGDASGDGIADLWVSAPYEQGGRVYFVPGPIAGDVDVTLGRWLEGPDGSALGHSLDLAGDVTGDGAADLVANTWGPGVAYVLDGPPAAIGAVADLAAAELVTPSGLTVTGAGDVTGDGVADLLAGYAGAGAASLVAGPVDGTVDVDAVAIATYAGAADGVELGGSVAGGSDVTGDGTIDLWVGDVSGADGRGVARMFDGTRRGAVGADTADARYEGEGPDDYTGLVVDPGDLDGDGVGDGVIGSVYVPPYATFVVYGPIAGTHDVSEADARFPDVLPGGIAFRVAADADADGCAELWAGRDGAVFQLAP